MRLLRRRTRLQRAAATVKDSLSGAVGKVGLPDRPVRTGLIAVGGLTGLTAGSAGISSLRRRIEGTSDDDS